MLFYNNYLSLCDIVYANKSKSSFSNINLSSLDLNLSTKDFKTEIKSYVTVEFSEAEIQSNMFLFFYITFCFIPFISLKSNLDDNYLIKTGLTGKSATKFTFNLFNRILFLLNNFFYNSILRSNSDNKFFINLNFLNSHYLLYYIKVILFASNLKSLTLSFNFKTKS